MSQAGEPVTDSEALDEVRTAYGRGFSAKPTDQTVDVARPDEFEPASTTPIARSLHTLTAVHDPVAKRAEPAHVVIELA
jgi:hypothetical protein